ncbi:MAG: glycerophosphodiester phosphodiesterase family protein [Myxococcota bacterium]|nr:glycerophosphodiester phosphodiesterase family protein [Myxococcota bacterium]
MKAQPFFQKDFFVVGHRGARGEAPEHTMAGFAMADKLGIPIEFDTMLCASGEPVVIHDRSVDRTTDGVGQVRSLSLQKLKSMNASVHFPGGFKPQKIPLLSEVLMEFKRIPWFNIEIKSPGSSKDIPEIIDTILDTINNAGVIDKVICTSFNPFILARLYQVVPEIPRGILRTSLFDTDVTFLHKLVVQSQWLDRYIKPTFFCPHESLVTPSLLHKQAQQNRRILSWTVNQPQRAIQLRNLGNLGIITDYPKRILGYL